MELELSNFNKACEDFLSGKYLLAEMKIQNILESIEASEKLKNIVATCIDKFNFAEAFRQSYGENQIISLPQEAKSIIAYCFSLLYNINSHNIDFFDFLTRFYGYNELADIESYKTFATSIILPFKEALNNVYAKTYILVDEKDYQSNIYNKLKKISNMALSNMGEYRLRDIEIEELETMLLAMNKACERADKETVYALLVGLDYFSLSHKKTRILVEQFKECFN